MIRGKPTIYEAGNVYARRPVIEVALDVEASRRLSQASVEGLLAALPPMREEVLDFPAMRRVAASESGIPVPAAVELLAVLAQRYMNWPVRFSSWRPGRERGNAAPAAFEIGTRRVGIAGTRAAAATLEAFLDGATRDDVGALFRERLRHMARRVVRETPALDAMDMARVASIRGISWTTLPASIYLRLGWGRHATVLRGSETSRTSSMGAKLAHRKSVSSAILRSAGLPAPKQRRVRRLEDAVAAAREIGFPLVVKPAFGKMGLGVSVGITSPEAIPVAFERAQAVSRNVLVEAMLQGEEYRLLAVGGRFTAAARRRPARVLGDGSSTVLQLVEAENARPERETILPGQMASRLPILVDDEAVELLAEQGLSPDAVPGHGQVVMLRRVSNISRGGDAVDETDRVHPSIRRVAERAATILGLDICGVDFVTSDVSLPWRETAGGICEVNSRPGLTVHSRVSEGRRRNVAADVVEMLYPEGAMTRPPVVLVVAGEETAPLVDEVLAAVEGAGRRLGFVAAPGRSHQERGRAVRPIDRAVSLLWDETIDMALVEVSARDVVRYGLGLDQADLAILPQDSRSTTTALAATILARVAGKRVVYGRGPDALERVLAVLGLPPRPNRKARPVRARAGTHPSASAKGTAIGLTKGLPVRAPDGAAGGASAGVAGGTANGAAAEAVRLQTREPSADKFRALLVGDIGFGEAYMHLPRAGELHRLLAADGHGRCLEGLGTLIGSTDLVIGNLAAPLARQPDAGLRGRKKHLLWSDGERVARALAAGGVKAVTLANKHALDCGHHGMGETIDRLRESGIASFGAGPTRDAAEQPLVVHFTVGSVARTLIVFAGFEHRDRYDRRYRWYAGPASAGVAALSPDRIASRIAEMRDVLPSPVFVAFPHWGRDYAGVDDSQRALAHGLVEAGIDLVIGHGSHALQPPEVVAGRPVLYGIGNFVWNAPGRYAKLGVKPFGVATSIENGVAGSALKLYPLLTDNAATGYRSRPVTGAEFAEAAELLAEGGLGAASRGRDGVGHYLELALPVAADRPTANDPAREPEASASGSAADILEGVE
jgi:cyanophycin synthetase